MSTFPAIRRLLPEAHPIGDEAALEDAYSTPAGRHLRADFVASLDGVIEMDGRSSPLAGPPDKAAFMAMRAVCDVVLVGAGTVRAENYGPVKLPEDVVARRRARGQTDRPALAIVSSQADLDPEAKVFSGDARPILLTTDWAIAHRGDLAGVADLVSCGASHVDLAAAMDILNDRGCAAVLCEGGPSLLRSLLIAGLVDEMCLTIAGVLAGSDHRHLTGSGPLPEAFDFDLTHLLEGDGMLLTRYARRRPA